VRERPNIKAIEFSGNDELDNDKLTEASRSRRTRS
jgi:outer membrane protein assembly factor BamA